MEPYALLRAGFARDVAERGREVTPTALASGWLRGAKSTFATLLCTEDVLAQVPLLTGDALRRGTLAPNSLVRVIGQVQDTFEPEMYPAVVHLPESAGASAAVPHFGAFHDTMPLGAIMPSGMDLHKSLMSR